MVRVPRYPASPVQEIFLPERVPFVQYDITTPSPTSPPPTPADKNLSSSHCDAEKNKMRDIAAMFYRNQANVEQLRQAKEKYLQCTKTGAVWELVERNPELKKASELYLHLYHLSSSRRETRI